MAPRTLCLPQYRPQSGLPFHLRIWTGYWLSSSWEVPSSPSRLVSWDSAWLRFKLESRKGKLKCWCAIGMNKRMIYLYCRRGNSSHRCIFQDRKFMGPMAICHCLYLVEHLDFVTCHVLHLKAFAYLYIDIWWENHNLTFMFISKLWSTQWINAMGLHACRSPAKKWGATHLH